ncbi:MAG: UDP-2,4-diacetamido-2,4,6-trideoxy-beta-L-altropyranose hydrolase [Bacteroidota bacterium]
MKKPRVYLRADGNSQIGLGHVYRLLALAEKLNGEFETIFLIREPSENIRKLILKYCNEIFSLKEFESYTEEAEYLAVKFSFKGEIIVLDGYNFDFIYQEKINIKKSKLVVIDDFIQKNYHCHIVINPSGGVKLEDYKIDSSIKIYTGIEYAFLRNEFLLSALNRHKGKIKNKSHNIFICLGGADPMNRTLSICKIIDTFKSKMPIDVVVGSSYLGISELETFAESSVNQISIHYNISSKELVVLMEKSVCGICSSSTVSYEYLCCNENLYIVLTAENQKHAYDYLIKNNLAIDFKNFNASLISKDTSLITKIFNGQQGNRLLDIFKTIKNEKI